MMKPLLLCFAILSMCCGAASPQTSSSAAATVQSEDSSTLKPENRAYAEAIAFAQFLNGKGIAVKSVHASKLNGFFQGLETAAFFRTEKGVVEVIFFPEPAGAERVQVREQREGGRYRYSFEGQPHPNPPGDTFDAARPMYFLMHRNWFMVIEKEELADALKRALTEG